MRKSYLREVIHYSQGHVAKSVLLSLVAQLSLTLCDLMDCSTPGFPVHHQLPELAKTHVHQVGDAIQPSHLLLSPFPPAFNLSQSQGLFNWVSSLHQVAKVNASPYTWLIKCFTIYLIKEAGEFCTTKYERWLCPGKLLIDFLFCWRTWCICIMFWLRANSSLACYIVLKCIYR